MEAIGLDVRGVRVSCDACGKRNRIPFAKLGRSGRCAGCATALAQPDAPLAVGSVPEFDALIRSSALPLLVDFWAAWCAPCRIVAPELEKVARARRGQVLVAKVDTEALPALAARFNVRSIPMLAVFRNGREVDRQAGAMPASGIQALLERHGAA